MIVCHVVSPLGWKVGRLAKERSNLPTFQRSTLFILRHSKESVEISQVVYVDGVGLVYLLGFERAHDQVYNAAAVLDVLENDGFLWVHQECDDFEAVRA